ncbi:hypothetical protein ACROYT_G037083 [Oculina patagonica]
MAKGKCRLVSRWMIVSTLVLLMLLQGALLDQYFYNHGKHTGWKAFLLAYVPAIALLVCQQIVETLAGDPLHSTERELYDENVSSTTFKTLKRVIGGYHKMFTWLLYVLPSIFQFVWILSEFVEEIETSSLFGPRFLKIILCFPSGVFLLLDTIEYAVKPELNVEWWRVFDLFDIVELLQILLMEKNNSLPINKATKVAMLFFGSISLFLPAFSLWELHACRKTSSAAGRTSSNKRTRLISKVRIASKLCQLVFVNLAFLAIRLVLFFDFKLDASVFAAKNTVAIIVGGIEIFSACRTKEAKEPKESVYSRNAFQNPIFESTFDGLHDTSLAKITTSCSTQTVAAECLNDQHKMNRPEELPPNLLRKAPAQNGDLAKRPCDTHAKETKSYPPMLDGLLLANRTSEVSQSFSNFDNSATFTKITESRSTQTTIEGISSDQLLRQCCDSHRMPRIAREHLQDPQIEDPVLFGDSRACSSGNLGAKESSPLHSALQQTTIRQEERSQMQNPRRKYESRVCSPWDTGANESSPFSSSQLKTTRQDKEHLNQIPQKENPILVDDSKVRLPRDTGDSESSPLPSASQLKTTRQEERFRAQNPQKENPFLFGNSRVRLPRDSGTNELSALPSASQLKTTRQEKRFQMQNPRKENPVLVGDSRVRLPRDSGTSECSALPSALQRNTTRPEERFQMLNPRKENPVLVGDSRVRLPRDSGASELSAHPSALQQKTTGQEERFQMQNPRKQNPVYVGDSRFRLPRNTGASESSALPSALLQKTTRQEERSQLKNDRKESPFLVGASRVRLPCDTGTSELNPLPSDLHQRTTSQKDHSQMQNLPRKKPGLGGVSRYGLPRNTRTKEFNPHYSPSLDDKLAGNGKDEVHLRFAGFDKRPTRQLDRPTHEYTGQRKGHGVKPKPRDHFP